MQVFLNKDTVQYIKIDATQGGFSQEIKYTLNLVDEIEQATICSDSLYEYPKDIKEQLLKCTALQVSVQRIITT